VQEPHTAATSQIATTAQPAGTAGTSAVLLIDFSKSFAPLKRIDQDALEAVGKASADLARQEWPGPVTFVWSPIQSASLVSALVCEPVLFQQTLIKSDKGADSKSLNQKLDDCTTSAIKTAATPAAQANYTDISGAVALAAEQGLSVPADRRYLIIISDFVEDLPPGKSPVKLHLNGERVLLLHRTGAQKPVSTLYDHLKGIEAWKKRLEEAGAFSVIALPVVSATPQRIERALGSGTKLGTDVVVLQNLPDTTPPKTLLTIAGGLSKAARDWPSPVTVAWANVLQEPETIWQMPLLEFAPRLIKDSGTLQPGQEFPLLLNEYASGMQRFSPGAKGADIAGALRFYASAGCVDSKHLFVLASSFAQRADAALDSQLDLNGVRVVMLPAPGQDDAVDEGEYLRRVASWEKWLRDHHANVCRLPLNELTSNSLVGCLNYEH